MAYLGEQLELASQSTQLGWFQPAPHEFESEFENWIERSEGFNWSSLEIYKDIIWSQTGLNDTHLTTDGLETGTLANSFHLSCTLALESRSFFMTEKDYQRLAPLDTRAGDVAVLLYGCKLPVILRPVDEHYEFVGQAFVLGFENGKAMDMVEKGELEETLFRIH